MINWNWVILLLNPNFNSWISLNAISPLTVSQNCSFQYIPRPPNVVTIARPKHGTLYSGRNGLYYMADLVFRSQPTLIGWWEARGKKRIALPALWEGNILFYIPVLYIIRPKPGPVAKMQIQGLPAGNRTRVL